MTPTELLERLAAAGVVIEPTQDRAHPILLHPASLIPDDLRPEIVAQKVELAVELVRRRRRVSEVWQADSPRLTWPSPVGEDPRPDLRGTELWARLLLLAADDAEDQQGVYGRLLGARACGAVLEARAGRWKLAPTLDPTERVSVWATHADWARDAAIWLKPKSQEITALLGRLPVPDEAGRG